MIVEGKEKWGSYLLITFAVTGLSEMWKLLRNPIGSRISAINFSLLRDILR